jgi:hypothetical protein
MSEATEIEFETVDSPRWPEVKEGAHGVARDRLQTRYDAVIQGAQWFRDDADALVKDAITKPPEHLSGFGALAEAVMAACVLLVPEAALAAEIAEAVKTAYETVKPAAELVEKANQEVVANSVEEARNYLQELTKTYAEDVADKAPKMSQTRRYRSSKPRKMPWAPRSTRISNRIRSRSSPATTNFTGACATRSASKNPI